MANALSPALTRPVPLPTGLTSTAARYLACPPPTWARLSKDKLAPSGPCARIAGSQAAISRGGRIRFCVLHHDHRRVGLTAICRAALDFVREKNGQPHLVLEIGVSQDIPSFRSSMHIRSTTISYAPSIWRIVGPVIRAGETYARDQERSCG